MVFYTVDTTISKYKTQGGTIILVLFANLRPHTKKWSTVGITQTSICTTSTVPSEIRRQLKLQLMKRVILRMNKSLVQACYSSFVEMVRPTFRDFPC